MLQKIMHGDIHNEFINHGWKETQVQNKYIYRKASPFDEFIIEYISATQVAVTVPIPFQTSSTAYKNTFTRQQTADIPDYIKLHLANFTA